MRPTLLLAALLAGPALAVDPAVDLRVSEGFVNPIGFYDSSPTFSWKLPPTGGAAFQKAYRIVVASSEEKLSGTPDLWDSGKVGSGDSVWLPYHGKALDSRRSVFWRVKFWDQDGQPSPWSETARFELGLLEASDWQGSWIHMTPPPPPPGPEVTVEKAIYVPEGHPDKAVDLTSEFRQRLEEGKPLIAANNDLAGGDPMFGVVKKLHLTLTRDGERKELVLAENESYNLQTGEAGGDQPRFVPERLRKEFEVTSKVAKARLHVTARGVYEVRLNGGKVGEDFMAPGWTPYEKKIETLAYDVTGQLRQGDNALAVELGEGWFGGRLGWGTHNAGRVSPQLLLQLEIEYEDGSTSVVASDGSWKATNEGPIRFSGIYDGEIYDARREMPGWDKAGFDDSSWQPVTATKPDGKVRIAPKRHFPTRIERELPAVAVTEPASGRFVFDLGQNMVGWPKLRIPVKKDAEITIRFAEMLEKDGTLYTANYRNAKSTDTYTAAAGGTVEWHPVFTFHGFRYVELSGFPEGTKPDLGWVTGVVLHSDFPWTGSFDSSHELLNQLQSNIQWGLRGNFLDVPTDCPQRDERLGWTGDAQVFAPAAVYNAGVHAFFASWLESMRLDQHNDGSIPNVIPNVLNDACGGPGWSDAATVIPWEIYVRTGDLNLLAENFDMMRRWVGYYESKEKDGIVDITAYGDWLQPYPQNQDSRADTPNDLLGTAYFARSTHLTALAAERLGKKDEASRLVRQEQRIAKAFTARYFDDDGKLTTPVETQTGYLVALGFDLLPEKLRPLALGHLERMLEESEGHLRTGFLGTPLLAPVLDRFGRTDLAYTALFKESYPSWFYSIRQGATTMWERWNSYSHEDGFGNPGMNSFNHYAYGAIGQWMYERIAGLAPDPAQPGYRHLFIQPQPGKPLDRARTELKTPYGLASSGWKKTGDGMELEAVIPPNTTATLRLAPADGKTLKVSREGKSATLRMVDGLAELDLPPGSYRMHVEGLKIVD
ncbi:family 78 glycoside hydrolase catalytic domain [Haloferula sargassicola]|uniref:alpha-L-rhamnosidase n=1 Tax=Haloferula sargassicola TaxID=490096 RepID=A0ABP9UKV8_9BACT